MHSQGWQTVLAQSLRVQTMMRIIKTEAATIDIPSAFAFLCHANGKPVRNRFKACVYTCGATIQEAINELNRIHKPAANETRIIR